MKPSARSAAPRSEAGPNASERDLDTFGTRRHARSGMGRLAGTRHAGARRVAGIPGHPLCPRADSRLAGSADARLSQVDTGRTRAVRAAERSCRDARRRKRRCARLAARSHRSLRISRHRAAGRRRGGRRLRRAPQRAGRRYVDALADDRKLESRVALSRGHRLPRRSIQTVDSATRRLAICDRAARSGAIGQSRRVCGDAAQSSRRFAARPRALCEEMGFMERRVVVRAARRVRRRPARPRHTGGTVASLSPPAGRGIRNVRVASFHRLSRTARAQRCDRLGRHRAPPVERQSRGDAIF